MSAPNPQAFPRDHKCDGDCYSHLGMTLRDYFAAKALALMGDVQIMAILNMTAKAKDLPQADVAARFAYGIADAMLHERERRQA